MRMTTRHRPNAPLRRSGKLAELRMRLAHAGDCAQIHAIMLAAFAEYRQYAFPSSALSETVGDVACAMARGGAVLVETSDGGIASVRFDVRLRGDSAEGGEEASAVGERRDALSRARAIAEAWGATRGAERAHGLHREGGVFSFSRLAVRPERRGEGIGGRLVARLERLAWDLGLDAVEITARSAQPDNRPYYERLGYQVVGYAERYGIDNLVTKMRKGLSGE